MKIKRSILTKKTSLIILAIVITLGLIGGYFVYSKNPSVEPINLSEIDENDVPTKKESESPSKLPEKIGDEAAPEQDNDLQKGNIEIPNLSRADQKGDNTIRVLATLQSQTSGYCRVNLLSDAGKSITVNASITVGTNYYSCSADISNQNIVANSTWTITVDHVRDGVYSTSDSSEVLIR